MEDKSDYNCNKTPAERLAWKEGAVQTTLPTWNAKIQYPDGICYATTKTSEGQSKETTEMMRRSLEQQYKRKQLIRQLFG